MGKPAIEALLVAAAASAVIQGCGRTEPVSPPRVADNAHPARRYEVLATILDDPGEIRRIEARVNYTVANTDCIPIDYTRSLGGSRPIFLEERLLPVMREGRQLKVAVAEDALLPEDYYGLGVCRWKLGTVAFFLHRNGVTSIVMTHIDERMLPKQEEIWRCAYAGNPAASDGLDLCLGPLAKMNRNHFRVTVITRRVKP